MNPTRREWALLATCALLSLAAILLPGMKQPGDYHGFADQRLLWGVPCAMDVLSNLTFLLASLAGAWFLSRVPPGAMAPAERAMALLFFAGLAITAAGSGWYHLRPDDAGLAIDRYAMSIAFAGLLGLGAAGRISARAGVALGVGLLLLAPAAVYAWSRTANVLPWVLLQGGGMALVVAFALTSPRAGALPVRWFAVIFAYGVAKVLELGDHEVYEFTRHLVSGHTLKHVAAACAALPVLAALAALAERGAAVQNRHGIEQRRTA